MNDRIREIERQCWSHRVEGALVDGQLHFDTQKFAELIVLECASFARAYTLKKSGIENPYTGAVFIENEIKKHFGIEQ